MVKPAAKRCVVGYLQQVFGMSERRACRVASVARATHRYRPQRSELPRLRATLVTLAQQKPKYGYRFLHRVLRRRGFDVNHQRVYRIYREEGLGLHRRARRRRCAAAPRQAANRATRPSESWAMDFVHDHTADGRRFRVLTIVDTFTRSSPAILVESSISGERVARALDELAATRRLPERIVVDNGPEFISNALDRWAYERGVKLHFIRPGKPAELDDRAYSDWTQRFIASVIDRLDTPGIAEAILATSRLSISSREAYDDPRVFAKLMPLADREAATGANRVLISDLVFNRLRVQLEGSGASYFDDLDAQRAAIGESIFLALFHDGLKRKTAAELSALLTRYRVAELQRPILRSLVIQLVKEGRGSEALDRLREEAAVVGSEAPTKRRELYKRLIAAGLSPHLHLEAERLLS